MGGQKYLPIFLLAGYASHDIIIPTPTCYRGARIEHHPGFIINHGGPDDIRICPGDGKCSRILRPRDVLGIEGRVMDFPIPLFLDRHQGRSPLNMGLVHREINPPPVPLVDIYQHQLPFHIHVPVGLRRSLTQIDHGKCLKTMGMEISLVGPQLKLMLLPLSVRETHHGLLKFPAVHPDPVLMHIPQSQGLHFP